MYDALQQSKSGLRQSKGKIFCSYRVQLYSCTGSACYRPRQLLQLSPAAAAHGGYTRRHERQLRGCTTLAT